MNIKRFLLFSTLALSLGTSAIVSAQTPTEKGGDSKIKHCHYRVQHDNKLLTKKQRMELHDFMKEMHQQMTPLVKEKRALRMQLMGKLATPGMQWGEVSGLMDKINSNNAKINSLFAKTQLQVFQKLGILMPPPITHKADFFPGKHFMMLKYI